MAKLFFGKCNMIAKPPHPHTTTITHTHTHTFFYYDQYASCKASKQIVNSLKHTQTRTTG